MEVKENHIILSSLREPLNLFEVEYYFNRNFVELNLTIPSPEEVAHDYIEMVCMNKHVKKETPNNFFLFDASLSPIGIPI